MKSFSKRLLALIAVVLVLIIGVIVASVLYISSPAFEERARLYVIDQLQKSTGGAVTLGKFDLDLQRRRFHLEDLTLRGLEPAEQAPLAHFERLDVGLSFRSLLHKRLDLFELILSKPEFHIIVGPDGKTNFPTPAAGSQNKFDFEVSIDNFRVVEGVALVNERRLNVDLALKNLDGILSYRTTTGILSSHIRYDGSLNRENRPTIPYSLDAQFDYTSNTLMAHQVRIRSSSSALNLQGKITDVLNRNIAGKLEYTGTLEVPILNYFFENEKVAGQTDVTGFLEFAQGYFFTRGNASAKSVEYDGWKATSVSAQYSYHFPDARAAFRNLRANIAGGRATGSIAIEHLPGPSRVSVDLDYAGIEAAALARAYPWDPKYRIFSRMTGTLQGWFEGKLTQYSFSGDARFMPYAPSDVAGVIPFPLEGYSQFEVLPGRASISNGDVRFGATSLKADGVISDRDSNARLSVASTDLDDLYFLYTDANGSGTFDGTLSGSIKNPRLDGAFSIRDYAYRTYKIEQAAGNVQLDTQTERADLQNVHIHQGESELMINGSAVLTGSPVDLRINGTGVLGADLKPFIQRNIDGRFSGKVHLTSLDPVKVEGDIVAEALAINDMTVGDVRSHVRYFDPTLELSSVSLRNGQAVLNGQMTLDRATQAFSFSAHLNAVELATFRWLGLPESLTGVVQQADFRGEGTTSRPNVRGQATVQNLSIYGEAFPRTQLEVTSTASTLNLSITTGRDLDLTAQVNIASKDYPFTSKANFKNYPLEKIAGLSEGTLTVTGDATLAGSLKDKDTLRGSGRIESAQAVVQENTLKASQAFTFDFNSERLTLSRITFTGPITEISIGGTIAFSERETLNLDVSGRLDLGLLVAATPNWTSSGVLNVEGRIRGTAQNPDLRGVAHFSNASLARRGIFTSLSGLGGDLFFDQNRVTLNNLQGRVGGGLVSLQGTALLRNRNVEGMNIRIDSTDVRVRYPEGLRTVVGGALVLRGDMDSPVVEGSLQIQSMSYVSSFEEFLTLFQDTGTGLDEEGSPLGRLRLAVHVEGNRNISIQNELADVEARVDLDVSGTVDRPALTGHVEASGGTIIFQGTRYRVTRGNVDFVDPLRIEPVVDIQAETELRDYRVILAISGRGDRLRLDLRSDPPLPQLEIVSLVAGGRTREELATQPGTTGALPTSEQLFQRGAGSILFDLLQSRVGNRFGLLGLDRVRIDPFLVGAENDPVARVTISEQVTKDLAITYSQDLSSNRQQVIIIEYFVTQDTSVVASRDETGALGLDVKFRKRFR